MGREQEQVLANLLQLYIHDFSEVHPVELGADGRYAYPQLALYWSEAERQAFLIRANGALAGFALVKPVAGVWDMAEFFVTRGYRRQGVGLAAAHAVWASVPGDWQVRVMAANRRALPFWQRAIANYTGRAVTAEDVETQGTLWSVFRFPTG